MNNAEINNVKIGDKVLIRNHVDNVVEKKGDYEFFVVGSDEKSFAVGGKFGYRWFYRNGGWSFVGDASFLKVI